ncbi:monovalent cation/H+ antiporter subunit D family protein [Brachybacterium sp. AOP43-C2-M15]|uniref:monovalent cation/H+ antiporter subunit D family protein n=1 Tax=Brachybacterium sp. AOP43-C2-M15 TaxID=3457661 RepID=UPI0040338E1F
MTFETMLPLLVGGPIGMAGVAMILRRSVRVSSALLIGSLLALLAGAIGLVVMTADGSVIAHQVGLFVPGVAIPFAVDPFSALVLTVAVFLTLVSVIFALQVGTGRDPLFAPLVLVLMGGVNGAFLTADIFNMFVFIEVMLLPSYGLLILAAKGRGTLASVVGSRLYVTVNLFISTLFLAGVGLVYGVTGTVNLGRLAGAASESPLVAAAMAVVLFALMMKASVVPVHGWLARSYPATSPAVTAMFSALHTKVAIYAIYRLYAVVFEGDDRYLWIGVALFSATMLIGVLGAVGENRMRSILAFHMVSQIGYILLGVALFTQAGLTAGIAYLLHHMIVKSGLFLSVGAIEHTHGTDTLADLTGRLRAEPLLALAFAATAMSLAGLPPFSGFFAKFSLILASVEAGQVVAAVIALLVSLITLQSMLKIFNVGFAPTVAGPEKGTPAAAALASEVSEGGGSGATQGSTSPLADAAGRAAAAPRAAASPTGIVVDPDSAPKVPAVWAIPALMLGLCTLGLGLGAGLLLGLSETAALGLLDISTYVEALS